MSFNYIWPIILVVISNIVYHITTKNTPENANSFLSLTITYLVGVVVSTVLYFLTSKSNIIINDIHKLNWTSFVLGLAIIGLETGYIYMYRAGWNISKGSLTASISLAIALVFVGILFYKEEFGWQQIAGITFCIGGLILINTH